ncbi:Hypothetical predicted protein [Marmota monax]|uniref:Uncharacterized protein n=1 Tax=Marmota monax TaxID=9995 RepID=A0A5E4AVS6_MARMO|nr:Hypothetical predicted protein [Marmota monax]
MEDLNPRRGSRCAEELCALGGGATSRTARANFRDRGPWQHSVATLRRTPGCVWKISVGQWAPHFHSPPCAEGVTAGPTTGTCSFGLSVTCYP